MNYTATEKKAIAAAWSALGAYLEHRPYEYRYRLASYVKEEIIKSKSPYLGQFSQAEARLYVMRAFRDGARDAHRDACNVAHMRQPLALAFLMGAGCGANCSYAKDHLEAALMAIDAACEMHDKAFRRFLEEKKST